MGDVQIFLIADSLPRSYFLRLIAQTPSLPRHQNSSVILTVAADLIPSRNVDYNPPPFCPAGAVETPLSITRIDAFLPRICPHNVASGFFFSHAIRASITLLHIPWHVGRAARKFTQ